MNRRQRAIIVIIHLRLPHVNRTTRINKVFKTLDPITMLTTKDPIGRCILHEERIDIPKRLPILRHRAAPMSLIDINLPLAPHIKKALLRMHIALRRYPRRRVHRAPQRFIIQILPLHRQRNGILAIFHNSLLLLGDAGGCGAGHAYRSGHAGQHPLAPIDVMGVEVVRDIRTLARPRLEGIELVFGLRHVRVYVLKVTKIGTSAIACIGIKRIQTLVNLHRHQHIVFTSRLGECLMMLQCLHDRFRHHHMHAVLHALHRNIEVGVIGCENNRHIPLLVGFHGALVRKGIGGGVVGEGIACQIHASVHVTDVGLHVGSYAGEFLSVDTAHSDAGYFVSSSEVEHGEGHDSGALVGVGGRSADVSGGVFACAYH
mmetsp:Transcript_24988/g.36687  ORF Transcript_24988/g.36687 Transcript_24988/m.36687 type:complete len:373 (-) Transcript_24988:171-1289(-)